jgi:glycosyltransferase involved in cell wall biosynthesis
MSSSRPSVLVLDEEIPFPPDTGKRIRTLSLLSQLAGEFEVDLLTHADGATPDARVALRDRGIRTEVAASHIPGKKGAGFYLRLAANLASPLPYSAASHDRPAYRQRLRELVQERDYDLVHCEWTPYARFREGIDLPYVVAAHNVESQVWRRLAVTEPSAVRRSYTREQARKMEALERRIFARTPFATAVSEDDAAILRSIGCARVAVVENGVDLDAYATRPEGEAEPRSLVFTGSLDWRPNQDAARWFAERVHPLLRREGAYRLAVVGRRPPAGLGATFPREIAIVADVEDIRPHLAKASVVVAPLRVGGGSRLKILEAFAVGRPVVSTTLGAEGLAVEDGRHLVLADEPEAFARAVLALWKEPDRGRAMAREARSLVEAHYGWDRIAKVQAALWREAVASGARA